MRISMEFEWDETKRQINLDCHGVDFERARLIWREICLDPASNPVVRGEQRHLAIGWVENVAGDGIVFLTVVYVLRNDRRRIISARPASRRERHHYATAFGPTLR